MTFATANYPIALPFIVNLRARGHPFQSYMFTDAVTNHVTALTWWKSQSSLLNNDVIDMAEQLFTTVASSAGVERVFSTFGLVHSNIRNGLGIEKAAKLVFVFKLLNKLDSGFDCPYEIRRT